MIFFPGICNLYLTRHDRELIRNIKVLRDRINEVVIERKEAMKKADFIDSGDFLNTLLSDDLFKNDNTMIIDECISFFIAGTQTVSIGSSNMILYMM